MHTQAVRRALLFIAAAALTLAFAGAASAARHIVLYKAQGVPADGGAAVRAAGGSVIASYRQIGVIVAESTSPTFESTLSADSKIESVAVSKVVAKVEPLKAGGESSTGDLPNAPATDADTFSPLQWDMRQIHAPEAHAVTGGSPAVVVGDIDTGLDKDHSDLIPNIDFSRSVSCESGAPNQSPTAWDDHNGHGTHTAGTIAARLTGSESWEWRRT